MKTLDRSTAYATWTMSLEANISDGPRIRRIRLSIADSWSASVDDATCLESMGLTAGGILRAVRETDCSIASGDAAQGFVEAYRD